MQFSEGVPRLVLTDAELQEIGLPELPRERLGRVRRRRPRPRPKRRRWQRSRPLLPGEWSVVMVMDRMQEAWETLARVPVALSPRGYANSMPAYPYDHADLVGQIETAELERLLKERNRIRLTASSDAIQRMEEALAWPLKYLSGQEMRHLAETVNLAAQWMARRADFNKKCKAAGINARAFRRRWMHALQLIAIRLTVDKVKP